MLVVGDAAGLALAPSGEGILAAAESGRIAAEVILAALPDCALETLEPYRRRIEARFGRRAEHVGVLDWPAWIKPVAARAILGSPWLTRRMLIENAFLHVNRPHV